MAHRTMVGGTSYELASGNMLRGGTGYGVEKGRALIGGTGYDVSFGPPPLNDCTWQQIREISDAGLASTYFSVGDTKTITLNGSVGELGLSNFAVDVFIIGIDHNSAYEGTNRIHFQLGKISATDICLCDSVYGGLAYVPENFRMNGNGAYGTAQGGWNATTMRTTLLGNNGTPANPVGMMAALPADLLAVMKPVTKYTNNSAGTSNSSSAVTATTDYLFLLAEYEIHGVRTYANQYEKDKQAQYDYYKAGNSKKKFMHNNLSTAAYWWCRSPAYAASNNSVFCCVNHNAAAYNNGAAASQGVAPCFCV